MISRPWHLSQGMSSVQALALLNDTLPGVAEWFCWRPRGDALERLAAKLTRSGEVVIGDWHIAVLAHTYPFLRYTGARIDSLNAHQDWTGLLKISRGPDEEFILFGYLNANGEVGVDFMASTPDRTLLATFYDDIDRLTTSKPLNRVPVDVFNGPDLELTESDSLPPLLDHGMLDEILAQAHCFFDSPDLYERLGIRYRRGFLFVGPAGCGKSMMIRHILWQVYWRHTPKIMSLQIASNVDDDDLARFFRRAAAHAPTVAVLEDVDGIAAAHVNRSAFLNMLDGLSAAKGVLLLATTNYPEKLDAAILHRPSRFDRVWRLDAPEADLRQAYLAQAFPELDGNALARLVAGTSGWSFAYLNELRVTAALLGLQGAPSVPTDANALEALGILGAQHKSGKQGHAVHAARQEALGFALA